MSTTAPVLKATGLAKTFGAGESAVRAVDDVSLDVRPGELVLVKGPSGSGKTTLLSILGGLMRPSAGTVELKDSTLTSLGETALASVRAREIGFVFQAYNLLEALDVEDNVLFPARLVRGDFDQARARASALIERLDLHRRRHARPNALSGGEKQRVAVARALINDPPLILADEPTGNLDSQRGLEVAMILHDIARDDRRAIVIVTHDERIEDIADRILWLEDGRLRDRKAEPHEWIKDPVCGMRVDRWTAKLFASHEGKDYAFCTRRCLERFEANPKGFLNAPSQKTEAD
ncbi:MAG: ATP-binding cassette domain-containing protein [Alphaproteobacteria bacterium]|nr:ATP-binding cassette domain-containing protein [Alphaproteobacteria bacterium]